MTRGRKPFRSGLRRAFWAVTAFVGLNTASILLPKDPDTDTQKITTVTRADGQKHGVNISTLDQAWKLSLNFKSDAALAEALVESAAKGDSWRVRAVLAEGRSDMAAEGVEALAQGAAAGHRDVVRALVAAGADMTAQNNRGIMAAAAGGLFDLVAQHLDAAAATLTTTQMQTLMMQASAGNGLAAVKKLVALGASPLHDNQAAFYAAVRGGSMDVTAYFLSMTQTVGGPAMPGSAFYLENYGYDPYAPHDDPFMTGEAGVAPHMLYPGFDENGFYPPPAVIPLIDVNADDGHALTLAALRGNHHMVMLLRDHGANPDIGQARAVAEMKNAVFVLAALDGKPLPDAPLPNSSAPIILRDGTRVFTPFTPR